MLRSVKDTTTDPAQTAGLVTYPNILSLVPGQTPNAMNVKFNIGGTIEKRLGSTTTNATALVNSDILGFSPDSGTTLVANMQAFWKMDEMSGVRADSFGSNDLSDNNSVGFAAGRIGNAAQFVASSSQFLAISDNAALSVTNESFSMAFWAYLDTKTTSRGFIGKGTAVAGNAQYGAGYNLGADRFLAFMSTNTGASFNLTVAADALGSPSTATWYFIAAWHDASADFLNIKVNALSTNSSQTSGAGPSDLGGAFEVGRFDGDIYMDGRVDEVGFWKKALNAQQLTDLYASGSGNTYNPDLGNSGWGMFDFGAGVGADGKPLRHMIVAAGSGIFASSNRGVTFMTIATDRGANYQSFERSKSLLIATSDTGNKVLYWAGSVGTFMAAVAPGSAPPAKYALDFQGFLLLMNYSGGTRGITYVDNTKILTDPYTSTFEIPSSLDDEITGATILNKSAYVFTKYNTFRVSFVGGNPDFSVQKVNDWGAVPRTIEKATIPNVGEVIIALGWDKKVRIFDGSDDKVISDTVELDNGQCPVSFSTLNTDAIQKSHAELDTLEQVYKLWIVVSPSSETTHCIAYNIRNGAWYPYDNQGFNAAIMAESGNYRNLFGVKRNGYVHWIDTTNRDITVAVDEVLDSHLYYDNTPRNLNKSQALSMYFSPTSSGTLYVQDRIDFNSPFGPATKPRDTILLSDTTNSIQVAKVINVPLTDKVYQWRLMSSASTANPWKLNRVDKEYSDLGGKG